MELFFYIQLNGTPNYVEVKYLKNIARAFDTKSSKKLVSKNFKVSVNLLT